MSFDAHKTLTALLTAAEIGDVDAIAFVRVGGGSEALRAHLETKKPSTCPECGKGGQIRPQRIGVMRFSARDRRPTRPGFWECGRCHHCWRTAP